ncbi:hypothetical protein JCM6882_002904 [Rhodosporidiobolus microsporus]
MPASSSRPITSPSAPSSSGFGQHTPALSRHTSLSGGAASSSSPPTDAIATPSADRYDAPTRSSLKTAGGRNAKQPRRSMRIRTSSGGGGGAGGVQHPDSSPQIHVHGGSFLDEAAPIALRPYSHAPPQHLAPPPSSARPGPARALSNPFQQQQSPFGHHHQHQQPHGNVARTPTHPHHLQAAIQLDAPFSSSSAHTAVRARPSFDDIMSRSAKRQKTSAPTAGGGLSSGLEAVRQWAQEGSASGSNASSRSSSSDDDEDAGPMLQSLLTSHQRRTAAAAGGAAGASPAKKAGSLLLPSPAVAAAEASPSTVGRGVLERYLSDRSSAVAATAKAEDAEDNGEEEEEDVPMEASKPFPSAAPAPSTSSSTTSALPPIPASPAARRIASAYPPHALLSPVPSRARTTSHGHNASVLFSPDVAKLLRSELDELEANELARGGGGSAGGSVGGSMRGSVRGSGRGLGESPLRSPVRRGLSGVDRSSDIVVDDSYSSPYQRNASPFSSPRRGTNTRDIFSSSQEHDSATKRARWNTVLTAQQESGLASPTPSSASLSLSMRAPSFCDSSPAASDRGSVTSKRSAAGAGPGARHAFLPTLEAHPASAPDFLYGAGIPSSSPTSSQHSEYLPARYHRSSPGPSAPVASAGGSLGRSESSSTLLGGMGGLGSSTPIAASSASSRIKRPALGARPSAVGAGPPYGQGDPHTKPTFSYAALIGQALFSTGEEKRMALSDIYVWVMRYYPYFKKSDSGWQNSIRHNLSLNPCFVKTARGADNPGKGCLWAIKPGTEDQFVDGDFVRKSGQVSARKSRGKKGRTGSVTSASGGARDDAKFDPQGLLRAAAAVAAASSPSSSTLGSPSLAPPPSLPPHHHQGGSPHHSLAGSAPSERGASPALSVASSSRPPLPTAAAAAGRRGSRVAFSPALSSVSRRSMTPALGSPLSPPAVTLAPAADLDVPVAAVEEENHHVPMFTIPPPQQRPATAVGFGRTESQPHLLLRPDEAAMSTLRSHSSMGFVQESPVPPSAHQHQHAHAYSGAQHPHPLPLAPPPPQPVFHTGAVDVKSRLVAPPVMRTHSLPVLPSRPPTSPPASSSSLLAAGVGPGASSSTATSAPQSRSQSQSQLHEPLLSATMSPPTSVYHRLAGPYQPLSYSTSSGSHGGSGTGSTFGGGFGGHDRTPSSTHRALALLASPEAGGIMPGRPGERAAALLGLPTSSAAAGGAGGRRDSRSSPPDSTPFLPAPQIFPSSSSGHPGSQALRRTRTESDKEDRAFGSMLSPGALVHTQSPISSVRGGPRQPMSPVQNASDKLEPCPDPEKKHGGRAPGTRLLPAVNALATSASSSLHTDGLFDPFRSPPPSGFATPLASYAATSAANAASKAHLRSPSARLQAALSTPGGTKGRFPLGFSPSLVGGGAAGAGGAWGVAHPSSSSRSGAAAGGPAWEDDEVGYHAVGTGVGGGFAWPSTPGMGIGREW